MLLKNDLIDTGVVALPTNTVIEKHDRSARREHALHWEVVAETSNEPYNLGQARTHHVHAQWGRERTHVTAAPRGRSVPSSSSNEGTTPLPLRSLSTTGAIPSYVIGTGHGGRRRGSACQSSSSTQAISSTSPGSRTTAPMRPPSTPAP